MSVVYRYAFTKQLALNIASDYFKDQLKRTDMFAANFANPTRDNFLENIALQFRKRAFEIDGQLLLSSINEKVTNGAAAHDFTELSPALSASFQPVAKLPLHIRASYKSIFRAPSFDDLYYTNIGNTALVPEYVKQYNLGVTLNSHVGNWIPELFCSVDAYYSDVKDKIIAVPRQNLFQWSMLNIGKADIKGIDVATHINFKHWGPLLLSVNCSYSFQHSLDLTDPSAVGYKAQLPYVPEHSGTVNLNISIRKLRISYNMISSAYRYRLGEQIPENRVQGWATHDVVLNYSLDASKRSAYSIIAEFNNIYNKGYEVIKYYPMPGFNFRIGMSATFKK